MGGGGEVGLLAGQGSPFGVLLSRAQGLGLRV